MVDGGGKVDVGLVDELGKEVTEVGDVVTREDVVDEELSDEDPIDVVTDGLVDTTVETDDGGLMGRPKVEVSKVVLNTVLMLGDTGGPWSINGLGFPDIMDARELKEPFEEAMIEELLTSIEEVG